ncbi:MAG: hypothetical protein ACREFQ_12705, partial [Stellaceae bacterium]
VFTHEPQATCLQSPGRLMRLYALTPAQAAFAPEILAGDGIDAAAARLGITRATAGTTSSKCFARPAPAARPSWCA